MKTKRFCGHLHPHQRTEGAIPRLGSDGSSDPIGRFDAREVPLGEMNSFKRIGVVAAFLLTVAAAFWAFQQLRYEKTDTSQRLESESSIGKQTSPAEDYFLFVDGTNKGAANAQPFIVEGLRKLAGAVGDLNLGTLDVQVSLRVSAEHVLSNPDATATTEAVRNALIQAAEAIEVERKGDGDLRRLAASLLLDRPLARQHQTILEFFQQSADAMQRAAAA